jgi:BNR/Asp-box repeat
MTSTPDGTMYYSTLALDAFQGLLVGVARSTDGGHTWTRPVNATKNLGPEGFQFDDKPAITAGRTPSGGSVLYDTWDDFACDANTCWTGLPVSRSTDGGQTWHVAWASKSPAFDEGCSFSQYIGAQPLINPANGTLFVAAERIAVFDPNCVGRPVSFSEELFTSRDAGLSFTRSTIANVTPAFDFGAMKLGPGMYMRTIEFPSLAIRGSTLAVTWNDGRLTGHSHILLATRSLSGGPWNLRFVTQGTGDEVQPAITADQQGFHIAYYQRHGSTLDIDEATSSDIANWNVRTITSRDFPGVFTAPQFDPIIAPGYMGDYLANVNVGGQGYFAWGDNRDVVTDALWPQGRHDPDVFFAAG